MTGANCYWALLRQDGSGTLEIATANAASTFTALALQRVSSSGEAPCDDGDEDKKTQQLQQLFQLLDAALRGFLASSRCLTRDSERYSVEARSLASSGSFDAAFNFLGRALEVCFSFFRLGFFSFFSFSFSSFVRLSLSFSHDPLSFPPYPKTTGRRDLQGDVRARGLQSSRND